MAAYEGIKFRYTDMLSDVRAIAILTRTFLDGASTGALDEFENALRNARNASTGRQWHLEIPKSRPIRTALSHGEYRDSEPASGRPVYGVLSCMWGIENKDKGRRSQEF